MLYSKILLVYLNALIINEQLLQKLLIFVKKNTNVSSLDNMFLFLFKCMVFITEKRNVLEERK